MCSKLPSQLYCKVLGNVDVKAEYKALAHKALADLGVTHPEEVAIKQMNQVKSLVALMPVSSFTAFAIWLDESYLNSLTSE